MSPEPTSWTGSQRLVEEVTSAASVRQVFGEPVMHGERTVIPMGRIWTAFGFGGGKSGAEAGGGGWVSARPVGVVELGPDGIKIHYYVDVPRLLIALLLVSGWNVFWIFRAVRRQEARTSSSAHRRSLLRDGRRHAHGRIEAAAAPQECRRGWVT